jgi:outer membrane protein assembly factor BamD
MKKYIVLLVALAFLAACAKELKPEDPADVYLQRGMSLFNKKRYSKAAEEFEGALRNAEDPDMADTAQIFLADSYFLAKDFDMAIPSYETYLKIYPSSKDAPRAKLRLGLCYYAQISEPDRDMKNVEEALHIFSDLRQENPSYGLEYQLGDKIKELTELLAERELIVAKFYFRIGEERPAVKRLHYLVENYQGTDSYAEGLYMLGEYYADRRGYEADAIKYFRVLITEYPGSKRFKDVPAKLSKLLGRITENLERAEKTK